MSTHELRKLSLKLREKIVLITIGLLFLAMLVTTVVSVNGFRNDYLEVVTSRSEILGRNLRSEIENFMGLGLGIDQMAGMNDILKEFVDENENIAYLGIMDLEGKVFYHSDPDFVGKIISDSVSQMAVASENPLTQLYRRMDGKSYYDTTIPIFDVSGEHLAAIRLGFPEEVVRSKLTGLVVKAVIAVVISFLAASGLLILFISRGITDPIKRLVRGSEEIGQGNYDYTIETTSGDEIDYLGKSFNKMAGNLKASQESLVSNIAELKQTEEALREAEEKYRSIFENAVEGIFQTTPEGHYITVNPALARMYGYSSPKELILSVTDIERQLYVDPNHRAEFKRKLEEEEEEVRGFEAQIYRKDGSVIWISRNARAVRDEEGKAFYYEGTIEDITERKQAEEATRESELKYRSLVERMSEGLVQVDNDDVIQFVNDQFCDMVGYSRNELIGNVASELLPVEDDRNLVKEKNRLRAQGTSDQYELQLKKKSGEFIWVHISGAPVMDSKDVVIGSIGVQTDITERVRAEEALRRAHDELELRVKERTKELAETNEELKTSLKEKEVLIKEVHHRVKNNLQVISSLLNLQSRNIEDQATLGVLMESQNRVRSIALIHEKLYGSEDLAQIDFAEYIQNLISHLFSSYGVNSDAIAMKIDVDDVLLEVDTAIPCGLIINELASNSLKHAFPDGREGEIGIELCSDNNGKLDLIVGDNGIGFPSDIDFRNTRSLGLQLVVRLVKQLKGTIEHVEDGGNKFKIRFEVK